MSQIIFDIYLVSNIGIVKVDGTSFPDGGSLVKIAHVTREICPRDLKSGKSKTNMAAQNYYIPGGFFPVCPRLDQNESKLVLQPITNGFVYSTLSLNRVARRLLTICKKNLPNERVTLILDKERCMKERIFFDLLYFSCIHVTC